MKNLSRIATAIVFAFASVGAVHAAHHDFHFFDQGAQGKCLSRSPTPVFSNCYNSEGAKTTAATFPLVRIRVIDPVVDESARFKIALSRPFFIIDGIHLSTDEARTLDQLHEETEAFGIPGILTGLGYTPVLVQFKETVRVPLKANATVLADLFRYLNSNKNIAFLNKAEDGFIVLGISQGGILGRYASYLYDSAKKQGDAPVRLYASLDSPHQGAVMPRGLISTLDFWANQAGVPAAEAFNDLITSPGARELLLYDTEAHNGTYEVKTGTERFLFGEYRKAATYKGFPAVLIAQGQMKGKSPEHASTYYSLSRAAKRDGETWGRAESSMMASTSANEKFSHNHMYRFLAFNETSGPKGVASHDFIQGSTYPFARTIYNALREGMLEAIPDTMSFTIFNANAINFDNVWDSDTLYQASSTFIPTASAMDLQCDGDLAIRKDCAFSKSYEGFPFEAPGTQSTAKATYAVDATHPRFDEPISGRHIEPPTKSDGSIDSVVLKGMQTDVWRVLCEVAKLDYDTAGKQFRNAKLTGLFSPTASCMDNSKMPEIIANGGILQTKKFGYIRYDYNTDATESDEEVQFRLPSGWQRVMTIDNAKDVPEGAFFEIEIKVDNPKSNWMKAELLLTPNKIGGGQVQLEELNIAQDGMFHTVRWQMPTAKGAMAKYRWFRLVLNSNGGDVTLRSAKLVVSSRVASEKPAAIGSANLFPSAYTLVNWNETTTIQNGKVQNADATTFTFSERYAGIHLDFAGTFSLDNYKELNVEYLAGTCQNSEVYFGTNSHGKVNLGNNSVQNEFVNKVLPLSEIVNTQVTAGNGYSASRLTLQALRKDETCVIRSIKLQ